MLLAVVIMINNFFDSFLMKYKNYFRKMKENAT